MVLKGKELDYYNKYVSKECQKWTGSGIFTMDEVKILRSVYKKWVKMHVYDIYGSVDLLENIPEIQFLNKAFKTSKKISKVFIDFDNHEYKQYKTAEDVEKNIEFVLKPNIYGYEAIFNEFKIHTFITAREYGLTLRFEEDPDMYNIQHVSISILKRDKIINEDYDKSRELAKEVLEFWRKEYGFKYSAIVEHRKRGIRIDFHGILGMPINEEFPDLKYILRSKK